MHRLKLYESDSTPNTTKKPVMSEVGGCCNGMTKLLVQRVEEGMGSGRVISRGLWRAAPASPPAAWDRWLLPDTCCTPDRAIAPHGALCAIHCSLQYRLFTLLPGLTAPHQRTSRLSVLPSVRARLPMRSTRPHCRFGPAVAPGPDIRYCTIFRCPNFRTTARKQHTGTTKYFWRSTACTGAARGSSPSLASPRQLEPTLSLLLMPQRAHP